MSLLLAQPHLTSWVTLGEPRPFPESRGFVCKVPMTAPGCQDAEGQIRRPGWWPDTVLPTAGDQLMAALVFTKVNPGALPGGGGFPWQWRDTPRLSSPPPSSGAEGRGRPRASGPHRWAGAGRGGTLQGSRHCSEQDRASSKVTQPHCPPALHSGPRGRQAGLGGVWKVDRNTPIGPLFGSNRNRTTAVVKGPRAPGVCAGTMGGGPGVAGGGTEAPKRLGGSRGVSPSHPGAGIRLLTPTSARGPVLSPRPASHRTTGAPSGSRPQGTWTSLGRLATGHVTWPWLGFGGCREAGRAPGVS